MPTPTDGLDKLARGIDHNLEKASDIREGTTAIEGRMTTPEARN
jgi:hypothetical protein